MAQSETLEERRHLQRIAATLAAAVVSSGSMKSTVKGAVAVYDKILARLHEVRPPA